MRNMYFLLMTLMIWMSSISVMEAANVSNVVGVDRFVEEFNKCAKLDNNIYKIVSYKKAGVIDGGDYYDCYVDDGESPRGSLLIGAISSPDGYLDTLAVIVKRGANYPFRAAVFMASDMIRGTRDMGVDDITTVVNAINQYTNSHKPVEKIWYSSNGRQYVVKCHVNEEEGAFVVYMFCLG